MQFRLEIYSFKTPHGNASKLLKGPKATGLSDSDRIRPQYIEVVKNTYPIIKYYRI